MMLRLIVGFLPWIIFGVLGNARPSIALILALAVSAIAVARQVFSHSLKILDVVTFVFFVFVAVGLIGFGWTILATYMTLIVNLTLMAVAWGSLLAAAPFTIQYARADAAGGLDDPRSSSASIRRSPRSGGSAFS
jgi:hypothetical protein